MLPSPPAPALLNPSRAAPSLEAACDDVAARTPAGSCSHPCILYAGSSRINTTQFSSPSHSRPSMYSVYPSRLDAPPGLGLALGTLGDRRYLRSEFRETPISRAIPRIDRPSPFISYSSLTVPPLSNSLHHLHVGRTPNTKMLYANRRVIFALAMTISTVCTGSRSSSHLSASWTDSNLGLSIGGMSSFPGRPLLNSLKSTLRILKSALSHPGIQNSLPSILPFAGRQSWVGCPSARWILA